MITFADVTKKIELLPALSNVTLEIQALYQDGYENVNIFKLVKLIESDATLTANVLKVLNSPKYGFAKKITSISQAVTLLGTKMIYAIVISNAINERLMANVSAYGVTNIQFNDMCHLQSALVMQWYSLIDIRDAQFLTSLALIMESGKLILAKEIAQSSYISTFRRGLAQTKDIAEYEYEMFETTSYYISGLLFEHWNLDETFIEVLKGLDFEFEEPNPKIQMYRDILDVIRKAINVKEILTKESIQNASDAVEKIGLSTDSFLKIANRVKRSYEESKGIV